MKQAILIIAHKNFEHLLRLIKYFDGACDLYIHVDKKSLFTKDEIVELKNSKGVRAVYQKYHLNWGSFNILRTEIFLLKEAVRDREHKFYHLISGQDYPLKPLSHFLDFFENTEDKGFVNCRHLPHPDTDDNTFHRLQFHYLMNFFDFKTEKGQKIIYKIMETQKRFGLKRNIPKQFWHLYCGSAWFSIDEDVAKYLLFYTKYKPFFYYRMYTTFVPEEAYVSTVLLNSYLGNEIVWNNNCREILWNRDKDISSPQDATLNDLKKIISRKESFFARKFDSVKSSEVIELLDKHSLYTQEIAETKTDFNFYHFDNGLVHYLIKFCQQLNIKNVIDFSCGIGWYISFLQENNINSMGFDENEDAIKLSEVLCNHNKYCFKANINDNFIINQNTELSILLNTDARYGEKEIIKIISKIATYSDKYILINTKCPTCNVNENVVVDILKTKGFYLNIVGTNLFRENSSLIIHKESMCLFEKIA